MAKLFRTATVQQERTANIQRATQELQSFKGFHDSTVKGGSAKTDCLVGETNNGYLVSVPSAEVHSYTGKNGVTKFWLGTKGKVKFGAKDDDGRSKAFSVRIEIPGLTGSLPMPSGMTDIKPEAKPAKPRKAKTAEQIRKEYEKAQATQAKLEQQLKALGLM